MRPVGLPVVAVPLALATALVLAACGSSSTKAQTSPSSGPAGSGSANSAPSSVTIGEIVPNAAFAASYAAQGIGAINAVDQKFNTKIKFVQLGTGEAAINAMLGGSAQVSVGALTSYLIVAGSGKKVVTTFAPFVGGGGVLIGAEKYKDSRGTDLSKFAGATFGYTREGSSSQLYMKVAVEKAGLNWDKLPHVAFGMPTAGLPLLEAGRVAVAAVDPSTAATAIASGKAYLVLNLNDPTTAGPVIGQQLGTVYGFNQSFTTQYPALTKAIVAALGQGLDAVKKSANDPAAVLKLFPPDIQSELSTGWAGAWGLSEPGVMASDGSQSAEAVKDTVSFAQSAGLLNPAQAGTASTVVSNAFLP